MPCITPFGVFLPRNSCFFAASFTAFATAGATSLFKGFGNDKFRAIPSSFTQTSNRHHAAAIFISSLISVARTSNAPRKIPGNTNTLLI